MANLNPGLKVSNGPLISAMAPIIVTHWPYKVILALFGSLLLILSAKVQVPFYPVPMTMQTFAVLIISMVCGSKLGALTVVIYLVEGLFGLPVFAGTPEKGVGMAYMLGPTGGYLIGFFISSIIVGYLADNGFGRNLKTSFVSIFIGTLVIFLCGYVWLSTFIGLEKAFLFGVSPFLWAEVFKIFLATILLPLFWKWLNKIN